MLLVRSHDLLLLHFFFDLGETHTAWKAYTRSVYCDCCRSSRHCHSRNGITVCRQKNQTLPPIMKRAVSDRMCKNFHVPVTWRRLFVMPPLCITREHHCFGALFRLLWLYSGCLKGSTLLIIPFFSAHWLMFMYYCFAVKSLTISDVRSSGRYFSS